MKQLFFLSIAFLLYSCGKPTYKSVPISKNFKVIKLAVIPTEVTFTGSIPKDSTQEELDKLIKQEQLNAQKEIVSSIMEESAKIQSIQKAHIQDINTTNHILEENGILYTPNIKNEAELCKLLRVEAILSSRVKKNELKFNKLSYGVIAELQMKTSQGTVLWKKEEKFSENWVKSKDRVLKRLYKKMASNFPVKVE